MNIFKLSFVFTLALLSQGTFSQIMVGNVPLDQNPNLIARIPTHASGVKPEIIISRSEYVISYNRLHRSMNWAAWELDASKIGHSGRSKFSEDQELNSALAAFSEHAVSPSDYSNTCFDRGHQVPSGDRTASVDENNETFLMSNMIPQTAYVNKGNWERFESYIRNRVTTENKKAYIVAGPIFDQDFGKIGPEGDIWVPSKDFKVVAFLNNKQSEDDIDANTEIIAVVMPNVLSTGKKPLEDKKTLCDEYNRNPLPTEPWQRYQTTLANVEKLSGFKIFPAR